jgi:probable HAF family extracellular repeat protein
VAVCLVALALVAVAPARRGRARAAGYTVTDLGTLGGSQSRAFGLNNCGRVVGDSWPSGSSSNHPFFWNDDNANGLSDPGEMKDLGTLGGDSATASALNGAGVAAGSGFDASSNLHSFVWTAASGKTDIGTIPGDTQSLAFDINDAGQVVGLSELDQGDLFVERAYVWDQAAGMRAIPASGGLTPTIAYGVNNAGQIVGVASVSGGFHAFLLNGGLGGTLVNLGTLAPPSDVNARSFAYEVNEAGQVVGYSDLTAGGSFHAFIWHDDNGNGLSDPGEMKDLGALAGGSNSLAYDINASGQVVGYSEVAGGAEHAFVYDSRNGMRDLNTLISSSGWTLQEARSINDRGQIVGFGLVSGQTHAFLLTPSVLGPPSSSVSGVSGSGVFNQTATLTATLTACGAPLGNKTITFKLNGSDFANNTATTDNSGVASLNVAGLNAGTYTIQASFAGDANNAGSSSTGTLTVSKASQTISVGTHAPSAATFNTSFTVAATSTSGLAVTYSSSGACTNNGATFTMTSGTGTCTVMYDQAGGGNYNAAAQVTESVTAQRAGQTISFGALSNKTFGDADFQLSATGGASGNPVTFAASPSSVCTVSGSTVHITGAGSCSVTASQSGNSNFGPAADVPQSFQVTKASQTITFGALPDRRYGSLDFPVSATGGASTSPVTFSAADNCTIVNGNTVHITGAGSCSVTASQAGDSNYNAAASVTQSFQVKKAGTFMFLHSTPNPSTVGQEVNISATVRLDSLLPSSPTAVPTGTVQFQVDGNNLGGPVNCTPAGGNDCDAVGVSISTLTAGDHALVATYSGDANFNPSTIQVPQMVNSVIEFTQSVYTVAERAGSVTITVRRRGITTSAASVDYTTDDGSIPTVAVPCSTVTGLALERCDYTRAAGTLNFAAGETEKTFTVLVNDDSYAEGTEAATLRLSNPTGGTALGLLGAVAELRITDDSPESTGNPVDDASFFVRQHYHDFLNREPDQSGLDFWTGGITSCGSNQGCVAVKRINTSAAFFLSIEFQETGYLVERFYKAAYGDATGNSNFPAPHTLPVPVVRLNEFLLDTQRIGQGVAVGVGDWQTQLENNKQAFALEFVSRQRFQNTGLLSAAPAQYVDALNQNAGGVLTQSQRDQLVSQLMAGDTPAARASVLRQVAESPVLAANEKNRAFVLMQFFGYLRRNPDDAQDTDYTGYDFWLSKLNNFGGDFVKAEMVKAFITSTEYRQRFGQP